MSVIKSAAIVAVVLYICSFHTSEAVAVSNAEWDSYKTQFGKTYDTVALENAARYNYAYNKYYIDAHNIREQRGQYTYTLKAGPFTDMRLVNFRALFPKTTPATTSSDTKPPVVPGATPDTLNLIEDSLLPVEVADQGTVCNSGWAFATAKAIELMNAYQNPTAAASPLSAQNLIDCAGAVKTCTNQIPQTAFDFLAVHGQALHNSIDYPIRKSGQGMCLIPPTPTSQVRLAKYSRILEGYDEIMKQYVAAGFPVVVEIDPTSFEFMNYGNGVFQQPRTTGGSHFVVVIGYGVDPVTSLEYWTLMNSFGNRWGDNGYMRFEKNAAKTITKSAIFPTEITP